MFWLPAIKEYNHLTILGTIWNIGAMLCTVFVGTIIFQEKTSLIHWIGVLVAFIACILLNW